MVVMFNVLGGVAVAAVVVIWRRNLRLRRRMMKASGMVRGTRVDLRAMLLIASLCSRASMQSHGMIGSWRADAGDTRSIEVEI